MQDDRPSLGRLTLPAMTETPPDIADRERGEIRQLMMRRPRLRTAFSGHLLARASLLRQRQDYPARLRKGVRRG